MNGTLTDIEGIRVGHAHDLEVGMTGCTVILCPPETVAGVDVRGGAPGTRETDLLRPMHRIQHIQAVFLAGGSAFGLAVGDGVMRYLEEQGIGYITRNGILVPIVSGAILFDLDMGDPRIRPDAAMGYAACAAAGSDPVQQGTVGAGVGAKVGSILGNEFATKGGIGSASIDLGNGLRVAALFAVNAVGDVIDEQGKIIAGVRQPPDGKSFSSTLDLLQRMAVEPPATNTVIGVVATNARLNKEDTNKVAQMAHDGLARAVRPAHLPFDGDTIFSLATGTHEAEHPALSAIIGAFAAEVTTRAIREAVKQADSLGGVLAAKDMNS